MTLAEKLENASDEEIRDAGKKLRFHIIKKFVLGVVVSVAVHFASAVVVGAIERKR
jgi:hypothetical protein